MVTIFPRGVSGPDMPDPPRKPFLFLALPPELRIAVYQLLLSHPSTIKRWYDKAYFSTGILRTCRQIHREARPILYSENTWQIMVEFEHVDYYFYYPASRVKSKLGGLTQLMPTLMPKYWLDARFKSLRRIELAIDLYLMHEEAHDSKSCQKAIFRNIQARSKTIATMLADLPTLELLHIHVSGMTNWSASQRLASAKRFSPALKPLTWLRHARKVVVTGLVTAEWAARLPREITQSSVLDHLPKVCVAMERFMDMFDIEVEPDILGKARKAARKGKLDRFMQLRSLMIEPMTDEMRARRSVLYEYDDLLKEPETQSQRAPSLEDRW